MSADEPRLREQWDEQALREYVRWLSDAILKLRPGDCYGAFLSALAKDGVFFEGFERARNDPDAKLWKKQHRPKAKDCFYNAQSFALCFPDAEYYEGYCYTEPEPFYHAWVVYKGKVFDFTLEAPIHDKNLRPVYLGLTVPTKHMDKMIMQMMEHGAVAHLHYGRKA